MIVDFNKQLLCETVKFGVLHSYSSVSEILFPETCTSDSTAPFHPSYVLIPVIIWIQGRS